MCATPSNDSTSEFELIRHYFSGIGQRKDVVTGIGDDGAVLRVPQDNQLVVCMDTLVEGVHFPEDFPSHLVGYRCLAVNLSDIAAMGAIPAWMTLSMSLPDFDKTWLEGFCRGIRELADEHSVALVGGDTVRGPKVMTVQLTGFAPAGGALMRAGAKTGDTVFVTGHLGSAAASLRGYMSEQSSPFDIDWFARPSPRVSFGSELVGIANACIDVSDGLLADLGHIVESSSVGVDLYIDKLPVQRQLFESLGTEAALNCALSGGDDYELCFTVPAKHLTAVEKKAQDSNLLVTRIGTVVEGQTVKCYLDGNRVFPAHSGYDHFVEDS
ncbi:MAG: thiamine-phosphate kinase [Pseudomonadota bacterium]